MSQHYIPLSFDLIFTLVHRIDVGFTATITGFINGKVSSNIPPFSPSDSNMNGVNYADTQRYDFWIAGRL